jgi:hypothetical protein
MKTKTKFIALAVAVTAALATGSDAGLVVSDLNHGVTPADLANSLVGSAVTISNITYTGSPRSAGIFSGGLNIVGFDAGIVLNSGAAQTISTDPPCSVGVEGPNTCFEINGPDGWSNSSDFGLPGDPDLTQLSGNPTFDATVLEFDFVPQYSTVQFRYVFSSEEYSDYSNTQYNDVFAFYINGVNVAVVPGTNEPVSINTINNGNDDGGDPTPHHPELFVDNVRPSVTIDTQMDGLTVVLTISATVIPSEVNHMKLAIADASDGIFDSAVFIQARSLISGTAIETSLTDGVQHAPIISVPQGTAVWDTAELEGVNWETATGTVTYKVFSDENCTTLFAIAGTKTVTNGLVPDSDPIVFDQVGTFFWQASYSGDESHNPVTSSCDDERVTVTPALLLTSAASRKTHGSAGTFDVNLPITGQPGVECRVSNGNHTLVFTFNNDVVSGDASVTGGIGGVAGNPIFAGNTMTVNLSGVDDVQTITVTLSNVTDISSNVLPDTPVSMHLLVGDANGNRTVNSADVAQTKGQSGEPVTSANFRNDVVTNGVINSSDVSVVKSHSGNGLP